MYEHVAELERSAPPSPATSTYSLGSSTSSLEEVPPLTDKAYTSSIHSNIIYSLDDHLATLQSLKDGDFTNEKGIKALPRRRNKSQRPLAIELSKAFYSDLPDLAAIINYQRLVTHAKAIVNQNQKDRLAVQQQPKNNAGGKLVRIQGPWAGQEIDPVDLKGPAAIPMPVEIGKAEDFEPIFGFLTQNTAFKDAVKSQDIEPDKKETYIGTYGLELLWKSPLLEFNRGIVYEDGRLDLCKKVVGPTHIGRLMESLKPNDQIRHFLLGNNAISTTGAKRIAEFIHEYPDRMETWYLAGCHITRHGLSLLVPEMINSSAITNLWFKRNPFGPNSSSLLAELVLRTTNLRTLDLETTELGDEGTRRFIDSIIGQPTGLRHLYLNANGIGQSACASLAKYLADPHCALESLFLSTNPLGDAGMYLLAPGIGKNKTLKRFTAASAGLTSKGLSYIATALSDGDHPLQALDFGASQTTKAHEQKFNYFDDSAIDAVKSIIMSPSLRWLNIGRTLFTAGGLQEVRSTAAHSELVFLDVHRVEIAEVKPAAQGTTEIFEVTPVRSCSLEIRKRLSENQAKYYPHIKDYDEFLNSEEFRFLRNTSDVRKIDSMYRTQDKRLGLPMDVAWEEGDPTWKLIIDDAQKWQESV